MRLFDAVLFYMREGRFADADGLFFVWFPSPGVLAGDDDRPRARAVFLSFFPGSFCPLSFYLSLCFAILACRLTRGEEVSRPFSPYLPGSRRSFQPRRKDRLSFLLLTPLFSAGTNSTAAAFFFSATPLTTPVPVGPPCNWEFKCS